MYKKTLAVFIFVFCLSFPVFSAEAEPSGINPSPDSPAGKGRESVLAFGFEYGNFWGRYSDGTQKVKAHKSAPGANMLLYSIRDGHTVGFFMHSFAGYPNIGTVNGIQPEYTDYVGDQIGLLLGPVFRHELNQKFDLFCGVGPNFFITTQGYTQYVPLTSRKEYFLSESFNIGIGADVMLKYAIRDSLFLFAGCTLTFDFLRSVTLEARPSNPALKDFGRVRDFSMFGIRPYVSIGFRL